MCMFVTHTKRGGGGVTDWDLSRAETRALIEVFPVILGNTNNQSCHIQLRDLICKVPLCIKCCQS